MVFRAHADFANPPNQMRNLKISRTTHRGTIALRTAPRYARRQHLRRARPRSGHATKTRPIASPSRSPDRTYCPPSVGSPCASNDRVGFGSRTCNLPRLTSLLARLTPNRRTATTLPAHRSPRGNPVEASSDGRIPMAALGRAASPGRPFGWFRQRTRPYGPSLRVAPKPASGGRSVPTTGCE